jgi:hypothetical protein
VSPEEPGGYLALKHVPLPLSAALWEEREGALGEGGGDGGGEGREVPKAEWREGRTGD